MRTRGGWGPVVAAAGCAACAGQEPAPAMPDGRPTTTSVEVSALEIRANGADRFVACPPSGELGQAWLPAVDRWASPPKEDTLVASRTPEVAWGPSEPAPSERGLEEAPGPRRETATERAVRETLPGFRRCYQNGVLHGAAENGRVALVLRVDEGGRVAGVESYAACALAPETIECMKASTRRLRFEGMGKGATSVVIPAVFTSSDGPRYARPSAGDAYAAGAYLTLEEARPALHACEATARRTGRAMEAAATFSVELDARGTVLHTHVDPWQGDKTLIGCAAAALGKLQFSAPPAGRGTVMTRVAFNPRSGYSRLW